MTRVLVTGGAGYIGSVVSEALLARGYDVRVVDGCFWGEGSLTKFGRRVEVVRCDLRAMNDDTLDEVEAVVHLAGVSIDPVTACDPSLLHEMNTVATLSLGQACRRREVRRLIFGSTCSVYEGSPLGELLEESSEVRPRSAYARSKKAAEDALLGLSGEGFQPVIARLGTVHGVSPRMRFDLLVNRLLRDSVEAGAIQLRGGGRNHRPVIDVSDVAEALITLLECGAETVGNQVFNVVSDNYRIRELAQFVCVAAPAFGYHVSLVDAEPDEEGRDYRCSSSKIRDRTGFVPSRGVSGSIEAMFRWLADNPEVDFSHRRYSNGDWLDAFRLTDVR